MTTGRFRTLTHWGAYDVTVKNGEIQAVLPFDRDPDPSPIGNSLQAVRSARIATPSVRRSWLEHGPGRATELRGREPFIEVSWDTALDLVAREIDRVRRNHGNEAIFAGSYGWSSAGRFHHAQSQLHRFMNCAGGYTRSVNTYSLAAAEVILPHVIGLDWWTFERGLTSWPVIADNTEVMICLGGIPRKNTQVQSGGIGRHRVTEQIVRCRERGVRFVNVSPLRDDLTDATAEWVPIKPGTDVALLLGMMHWVVAQDRHDRAFLDTYCVGWEQLQRYIVGECDGQPKDPTWAARITGVAADTIIGLARMMTEHRSLITASWSLQRSDHGEQAYWAVIALAAVVGQIGLPGGGFGLGYGSAGTMGNGTSKVKVPTLPQGRNDVDSFIPVARISDMLLHPGVAFEYNGETRTYPDVRMVYWAGGNPFHHQMDLNRLRKAWTRPETVVVNDGFWTATARHADVVFPATTPLERNDIGGAGADGDLFAMHRSIEPVGQARDDFDIFAGLATRLGFGTEFTEGKDAEGWVRHLYQELVTAMPDEYPPFETFWDRGYIESPESAALGGQIPRRVLFDEFRRDPSGCPLGTPSGRITLFSERIAGFGYPDCPPHPTWLEPYEWLSPQAPDDALHLLSHQPAGKLHSQWDHGPVSQATKIDGREPLLMNPDDARRRGLTDRQPVLLANDRGSCYAAVRVTDGLRAGVVVLATGSWYDPDDDDDDPDDPTLPPCRHGNPNVLTRDRGTSRLAQGPTAQTCLVTVTAAQYPPQPHPFRPPQIVAAYTHPDQEAVSVRNP